MTINILGQEYDIRETDAKKDTHLADCDGYCDGYGKIVRINNDYNENHPDSISDFQSYKKRIMRHEIIHAFFEESGLKKYQTDELIVEWIANQFPKLEKIFKQAGAL